MRRCVASFSLVVLVAAGCNQLQFRKSPSADPGLPVAGPVPTSAELVQALNENARRVQGIECRSLDLDCAQGHQPISLMASMVCQKPRSFRMSAKVLGNPAVDIGSNDQEFWYWISKAEPPYLFHCSYQDLQAGRARMPFPFQPDWMIEALGIAEYDPAKTYEVRQTPRGLIEMVERTTSPQGQPVAKVTILQRGQRNNGVFVVGHVLKDASGKEICSAYVRDWYQDRLSGAVYPKVVELKWPAEQITMKMRLEDPVTNPQLPPQRVALLFTRPTLRDVQPYNLAAAPQEASPVRRAGGFIQR